MSWFQMKELTNDWLGYYINIVHDAENIESYPQERNYPKTKQKKNLSADQIYPDGNNIAWVIKNLTISYLYSQYKIRRKRKNS